MTRRGRRSTGSPDAARMTPQTGRLSAPATCTRPFGGTITPGVARPWITRIVAMAENAMPIHTAWPSFRRAAMIDIATADVAATAPATPTTAMCTAGTNITITMLLVTISTAGITAERASSPSTGRRGRISFMVRLSGAGAPTLRTGPRSRTPVHLSVPGYRFPLAKAGSREEAALAASVAASIARGRSV